MEAALVKKYEDILASDPSSRVFAQLGELYRKLGMTDKALAVYRDGIQRHPSYLLGYMGLAFCYYDLEQFQLAYATLRPIVDTSRDNIRLQKLFANSCEKLNYKHEALTTWKYLLFINPKDPEISAKVLALESQGDDHQEQTKYPQKFDVDRINPSPIDDVDDWIRMDLSKNSDEEPATKNEIGTQVINLEASTEEVRSDEAESPLMSLTLVDLYLAQGHLEKAKDVLEKMADLNPSDERIVKRLSEINKEQVESQKPDSSEEDGHAALLSMVEEKQNSITDEDDEIRVESVNLLDKFLSQIKQRAEQKTSQS